MLLRDRRAPGGGRRTPLVDRRAPRRASLRAPRTPWWRRVVSATLWTVAVTGVGAFLVAILVPLWYQAHDQRLLIVTSGSMEPQFSPGDAVVLRAVNDPSELKQRLVVTFQPTGRDELVTHRIVAVLSLPAMTEVPGSGGRQVPVLDANGEPVSRAYIRTQGDANAEPDPNATPVERVRGIVLRVHEGWGRPLAWASSPAGRAMLLVPPLLALVTLEVLAVVDDRRRRREDARRRQAPPDGKLDALLLE
ncbi:signal peptidase I [Cellulomonas sp. B6]|uniref:signal peptidase I n=1 Tax=Cellulomonas sp. B6 TaxID=1295626 RepID=UPI000B17590A|nr:signal peptidase I [Cellulomonas sp. B6]